MSTKKTDIGSDNGSNSDNKHVDPDQLAEALDNMGDEDLKAERALRKQVKKTARSPEETRNALRRYTRIFYDIQRLRIQCAGRTYDRATGTEIQLHEVDIALLEERSKGLARTEKHAFNDIKAFLETIPAYTEILAERPRFKGIGPTMAGVILSEVDITRANTASALWRYAGLAPIPGHRCTSCNDTVIKKNDAWVHEFNRKSKCSISVLSNKNVIESHKSERPTKGEKLPYNKFLKTKMVGVMAGCLLKAASPYRSFYDNYKHRLQSAGKGRDDGHRHQMAMRYMVKMVLLDIWKDWRTLEGLEVRPSYQEEYLGHKHAS